MGRLSAVLGCLAVACGGEDSVVLLPDGQQPGALQPAALQPDGADATPAPEPDDSPFYDFTHRVEVEVELDPSDWQSLRADGRSLAMLFDTTRPFEYASYVGTVRIDGQRYEQVQIRKKGFLGSLSALKPSIKMDLGELIDGQHHLGVRRVTLNNDKQDPSHTHQCLAYHTFARAGLPAPRCNLAHVVINGEDFGTYSNVEPIDGRFLRRHFASAAGNLYEGQASDVAGPRVAFMEAKNNQLEADRSDLDALAAALEAPDSELVARLGTELDIAQFRDFWATETLLGHWDGYSGNTNNYFVYRDPTRQRFTFLPWGTDAAFEGENPFDPANVDVTVYASGRVANRLYKLPDERALFRARLSELNETLWDEAVLLAEVDQVEAIAPDAAPLALAAQREHITTHREVLRAALAAPARDWEDSSGLLASPCIGQSSEITGQFDTSFGSLDTLGAGMQLQLMLDGAPVTLSWIGRVGLDAASGSSDPVLRYVSPLADGRVVVANFTVPSAFFNPGAHPFHGLETAGTLFVIGPTSATFVGIIGDGTITLDAAASTDAAPVTGSLAGSIIQFGCAEL
jgi:spore coat protein H